MPRNAIQIRDADDDIAGGLTAGYRPNLATTPAVASATLGRPLVRVWLAGSGAIRPIISIARSRGWFPAAVGGMDLSSFMDVEVTASGGKTSTPKVGYARNPSGPSKKVRTAMGRQICALRPAGGTE